MFSNIMLLPRKENFMKITKAVIPVAGKGTRFLPASKGTCKEMFPLVDKPCLLEVLEECFNSGIRDFTIVLSKDKEYIRNFLAHNKPLEEWVEKKGATKQLASLNNIIDNSTFHFCYENPKRTGSAGAVYAAKKFVKGSPFAVLYPDDINYTPDKKMPAIGQLAKAFEKTGKMVIGCKEVPQKDICKYSACKIVKKVNNSLYEISDIVEKPKTGTEPSLISGLARYIMPANTFDYIEKQIKTSTPGVEIGLTDTMSMILKDENAYAVIMDSIRYDTGDKLGYLQAVVEYGLRDENLGEKFKEYLKGILKK